MRTQIRISGQVAGNNRLHLHINRDAEKCERFLQDFILTFRTKKEVKKALWNAFRNLKSLERDFYKEGGISYKPGYGLRYDASYAKII